MQEKKTEEKNMKYNPFHPFLTNHKYPFNVEKSLITVWEIHALVLKRHLSLHTLRFPSTCLTRRPEHHFST